MRTCALYHSGSASTENKDWLAGGTARNSLSSARAATARWARIKQGLAMRAQHFLRAQRRAQRDLQQRREKAGAVARAHLVRQLVRVEREGEAEVQAAQHLGEAAVLEGVGAREQGAQRSLLASAVLDQYYGDRSSFYFYHRDQPAHTPTLISSLQLPGQPGQPADLTTPAGVKAACRAFQQHYSAAEPTGVYVTKPVDTASRATLLGSLTSHLTPTQTRAAEGPDGSPMLSEEELGRALKGCAHSKAPGVRARSAYVTVTEKLASGTCLVSSSGRPPGPRGPPGRYPRTSLPLLKPLLLGKLVPSLQVGLQVPMLMLQPMKQFATVDLCLPGHCATCKLTVMPSFVQGYDVLLGDDWLFANKAILSYEGKTLSLSAAGKTAVTLPCPAVAAPKYVGQCSAVRPSPAFLINALKAKPELISATQASRWLLKGGRAVVALVMTEGSASASPGTPSDQDNQHIPAAIKADLQTLLDENSDVFKPLTDTPPERPVGHTIPLVPDARPPVTPMYRLSKPEQEELKRQIQDYLAKGMIEPSSSPYAAPILFVQKKSGELRMCIDYRQLNKLTLRDQYPLPRIDDLFDRLSGCSVFSSLDLQAGYHQIRITPEDVPKTAFRTPEGHFQFKVLSFGLTNAPATFQRVMNDAFASVLGKCALVYLDDILVMSKSLPEHMQHLRLVFDLLRKNKLYAKMSKCEFMQLTLRFLGHVISAGAISVDPDKVRAIVDWPVPSSLTQLQSFLGAANFVRKFVHNFSAISAPLTDLCGKLSATFSWHSWPDHERHAFYELKAAVANVPMLRLPDHTQPFQVYCDASLQGVGAVLMQDGYPLAYLSKKLSSAEVKYTTGEQEMLALVTACKEWRCYLEGVPFTLFTDHKPLISLPTQKNLSRRQARWMELLSRFDFKLEYIPGPVNPADPLSRLITGLQESATVCAMLTRRGAQLSREGEGASVARALEANAPAAVTAKSSSTPEITENTTGTSHNRDFVPLVTCTSDTSVHYPAAPAHPLGLSDQLIQGYRLDPAFNAEADLSSMYQDTHGLWRLTGKDKVVVPNDSELRNHILHEMHDAVYSGHVGINKTLERVSRVFWWNTMRADVRYYVSTCDACQRDKASSLKPGGLLNPLSIPDYRWESVSMDFITKLPAGSHGYDAICVFVDRLSKMVHFVPCREDLKARRFAQLFIDHVYKLHGMPAELISDRGSLFTSVFWREIMRRCGSKPALSSSYHPQSDGQTERYNRVLEEMLRHYISPTQSDWPDYLALAEFAVNNSWQESIQSTPFLVNTGQSPVTVGLRDLPYGGRCPSAHAFTRWWQDAVANARKCMAAAQSRQAAYANKAGRDVEYKVGQKVLLSTKNLKLQPGKARKLIPRYVGPFEILLLVGAVAVKLDLPASMSRLHPVFHVSLIKPYTGTDVGFMPPPVTWMDETPVYYVERLLDHKGVKDNKASYYLVQWEGYDSTHNTWEPRSNLTDCDKVLAEYNAIHHLNTRGSSALAAGSVLHMQEARADTAHPAPLAEFLTGIITLMPEAGKPRDQVAGYRPITLLNCDVRLVARAVEDRLQLPLDQLVSPSQSAFILGRDISDSVQFHLGLLEYL
ncbi:hypothetical protein QJQ45_008876 [Haematococcus lacustris]|nr:hypothetical protein QJQ45_008876 [Haematococcus lacustris]